MDLLGCCGGVRIIVPAILWCERRSEGRWRSLRKWQVLGCSKFDELMSSGPEIAGSPSTQPHISHIPASSLASSPHHYLPPLSLHPSPPAHTKSHPCSILLIPYGNTSARYSKSVQIASSSISPSRLLFLIAIRVTPTAGIMSSTNSTAPPTIIVPQANTQHFTKYLSLTWQTANSSFSSRTIEQIHSPRCAKATRMRTMVLQLFTISRLCEQMSAKTTNLRKISAMASARTTVQKEQRWGCMAHWRGGGWRRRRSAATRMVISARKVGVRFWQIWMSFWHIFLATANSQINIIPADELYQMKLLEKGEVKIVLSLLGMGAVCYGLYRLYHSRPERGEPSAILSHIGEGNDEDQETFSFMDKVIEHTPYETLIEDAGKEKLGVGTIALLTYVRDIHYKIILSLMKGNSYQGIVTISFHLDALPENQEFLGINYNGGGIKYVMVNNKAMAYEDVHYAAHKVFIPRQLLREKSRNNIEIIFENLYSFLNHGLSAFFLVDDNQKYSLKQQVIYSVNGYLEVEKIIPCINCLNECKVQLEVIHPDTFDVFSNTSKSLERLCSINEYQKYPFLFDLSSSALNKSFKLNESTVSAYSGIGEQMTGSYSSIYYNRKKANTHFYQEKLPSIHHMFIFSSTMMQLQPTSMNNPLESELLIRYFCKHTESIKIGKSINKIHNYILDIFRRLSSQNIKEFINKIDILIIGDRQMEGYFAPGVIMLSEDSLAHPNIDIRCYYLLVRALIGLLHLQKGKNVLTLKQILYLNEQVFARFEEFRYYLFLKNMKYQKIKALLNDKEGQLLISRYEGYFIKYYQKQLKFIILEDDLQTKIKFEVSNPLLSFNQNPPEQFWENFLSNYNFLSPLIVEPLINLGISRIGIPTKLKLLEQLKACFSHSKYILSFYTNEEISDNLPGFIEQQTFGLDERLTQLKVKQKFKDFITQKYEKYLPIKSNMVEAESMYIQFKRFNENKNFHHIGILQIEIRRVCCFGQRFIAAERVPIDCSIVGWKLLTSLKIYPLDEDYYQLIKSLEGLKQ